MNQLLDAPPNTEVDALVESVRRIGETGPIYQVLGPGQSLSRGCMQIEFPENDEVIEYPLDEVLDDRVET